MTNLDDKFTAGSVSKTGKGVDVLPMRKSVQKKADGRTIIFYSFEDVGSAGKISRKSDVDRTNDSNPEVQV